MSVPATGFASTPLDALRQMLSNSTNFQQLVGAGSAAAALASIGSHGVVNSMQRPGAWVGMEDNPRRSVAGGLRDYFLPTGDGELILVFEIGNTRTGTLTGVTSTSVVTDSTLIGSNDYYTGKQLQMTGGTDQDDNQTISSINFTTGAITLASPLAILPNVGDAYRIYAFTPEQSFVPFLNTIGAIQSDIEALSGQGGYISIRSFSAAKYGRSRGDEDQSDYCLMEYRVRWGI